MPEIVFILAALSPKEEIKNHNNDDDFFQAEARAFFRLIGRRNIRTAIAVIQPIHIAGGDKAGQIKNTVAGSRCCCRGRLSENTVGIHGCFLLLRHLAGKLRQKGIERLIILPVQIGIPKVSAPKGAMRL